MAEISETEHNLIGEIKRRGVDKDGTVATVLLLKTEENCADMLEWLKLHPEAVEEDIDNRLDEMGL